MTMPTGTILLIKGPSTYEKKKTPPFYLQAMSMAKSTYWDVQETRGHVLQQGDGVHFDDFEGYSFYNEGCGTQGLLIENQSSKNEGPPLHWANPKFYANRVGPTVRLKI